jgi:predicted small lipoprotein YifL
MKKFITFFLTLMMMISLAACGGESPSESSTPTCGSTTSDNSKKEEAKVYGIGEAAEANGLSVTIDKVAVAEANTTLEKAKDGFEYIKVWFTFKNISNETIESPKAKAFYIVYTEGATGDDSDMKSEENSQVMLEVADRNERYMSRVDLAPGESTSGWMIYQYQADKSEITMHYYAGFVNVAPDLRFRFAVE